MQLCLMQQSHIACQSTCTHRATHNGVLQVSSHAEYESVEFGEANGAGRPALPVLSLEQHVLVAYYRHHFVPVLESSQQNFHLTALHTQTHTHTHTTGK